jgi:2-(1,2-epoxy-1,2-dihydrophenyl)acetyl-CoA isomerase
MLDPDLHAGISQHMSQSILVALDEGVQRITLNRPDKLNSFNPEMHARLREALAQAERDASIRALLITGAGRGFCAGQDLAERKFGPGAPPVDLGASLDENYNPLVRRLRALAKPVVCAVNGVAAGAGANFALACDIVLAARSASFVQAFAKIGLLPDSGGTWFLPRLVGTARAMGLALLAEKVSAEDAERIGLIWKCVDDDRLAGEAQALARRLAAGPTKGYGLVKRALHASLANDLDRQLDLERDLQREAGLSEDYREGVTAFKEKRVPQFKGR